VLFTSGSKAPKQTAHETNNRKACKRDPVARPETSPRGFNPEWYPKADGREAPTYDSSDPHDRIRLQFITVYYELNRSYARLLAIRRAAPKKPGTPPATELTALKQIEAVLRRRDALEDQYACLGVIAEPVVQRGFTVDVTFSFGAERRATDFPGGLYFSAYITIPLPAGVKLE
jgi:hypothetical protein